MPPKDSMAKKTFHFQNPRFLNQLYCGNEDNLIQLEKTLDVQVVTREDWLTVEGPDEAVERAESLFDLLQEGRNQGLSINNADFLHMLKGVANGHDEQFRSLFEPAVVIRTSRRTIIPKTLGQKKYLQAIKACDIVFGIGPAGTGQDLPGHGRGCRCPAAKRSAETHPHPPGGRSGRSPRISARRPDARRSNPTCVRSMTLLMICSTKTMHRV